MTTQTSVPVQPPSASAAGRFGRSRDEAWFRPRRKPGRIGPISLARLLVFELVQLSLCFFIFQALWALIVGGLVGVAAAVATFGWRKDKWWTEILRLRLRFRARRGIVAARRDDPRLVSLCELAPDLTVEDVAGVEGARLGMGSDGAGWFAVLEVGTDDGPQPPIPLSALARIATEAEQAGVVVQVVLHSAPLTGANQRDHATWLAVRLDSQTVAQAAVDRPGGDLNVPVVLAELTRRVDRSLRRRGLTARMLDSDGLLDALVRSCDLGAPTDLRPVQPQEEWDCWRSTKLTHGCFWMRTWPNPERGSLLLSALAEVPDAQVNISIVVEPEQGSTGVRGLVRVATAAEQYQQTCDMILRLAEHAGGRLSRLDGQQLPAVYASAPTGGGAR
ncbi:type VII secretion protein EccE [Saccharopolyspora sp. K220]|uniref:type VII secretion protein EccE n=1 Tax=Saccharopolyspora soli TaxID=2926618 RepID=UPI001F55AC37|nr:type VII secretion protein EccE [Saccharopolyspora soli]MCI2424062.1 type VII secretion protein EccE [Saccharopolyspora soli]